MKIDFPERPERGRTFEKSSLGVNALGRTWLRYIWLLQVDSAPVLALAGLGWLLSGILLSPASIEGASNSSWSFCLLLACFLCGRTAGMSFNRLIDAPLDARNPRTMKRALPSGRVEPIEMAAQAIGALALFLLCAFFLPTQLCYLALVVSFLIVTYSFTKRYTWLCHYVLAAVHFCVPLTGALWMSGNIELVSMAAWCASFSAFFSVAGADIIYALQDEMFDRRAKLFSIPVRFGHDKAVAIAAANLLAAFLFATVALVLYNPLPSILLTWGCFSCVMLMLWQALRHSKYIPSAKLFSVLLVYLPLTFTFSVLFAWLRLDISF